MTSAFRIIWKNKISPNQYALRIKVEILSCFREKQHRAGFRSVYIGKTDLAFAFIE